MCVELNTGHTAIYIYVCYGEEQGAQDASFIL